MAQHVKLPVSYPKSEHWFKSWPFCFPSSSLHLKKQEDGPSACSLPLMWDTCFLAPGFSLPQPRLLQPPE